MSTPPDLSALSRPELEAFTLGVMAENAALTQTVAQQRAEIARLKGLKARPDIKPSGMEKATVPPPAKPLEHKRRRGKVWPRVVVEDRILKVVVPPGSRFKGHENYTVQELVLTVHAVRYRRERWLTPDGKTIIAPQPAGTKGYFGPNPRRSVLKPYHQGQSTPPVAGSSRPAVCEPWPVRLQGCAPAG